MLLLKVFSTCLDKLTRIEIQGFGRFWSVFHICGYTGLGLASLLATVLVALLGLSLLLTAGLLLAAVLTFFGLAMATKIIAGEEKLIYFHHEIAAMVASAVLL